MISLAPYIGTAGWNIPAQHRDLFPDSGSHLERYAEVFSAVEVNSSFYRSHQYKTWQRWAAVTPDSFAFCVKVPKTITHESRLQNSRELIERFKSEVTGLGGKLKALLIQMPPSLKFEAIIAHDFFSAMQVFEVPLVVEPRHVTWFSNEGESLLSRLEICRAAVDPSPVGKVLVGAPTKEIAYFRLHGSPVTYYSDYSLGQLATLAERVKASTTASRNVWCIFDNTADGHAASNALTLIDLTKDFAKGTPNR